MAIKGYPDAPANAALSFKTAGAKNLLSYALRIIAYNLDDPDPTKDEIGRYDKKALDQGTSLTLLHNHLYLLDLISIPSKGKTPTLNVTLRIGDKIEYDADCKPSLQDPLAEWRISVQ